MCRSHPRYGSGRQAPPPARARTFYSPVRRSAKCLGAGSEEIEKEIQRYRCGLGGEGAGLGLETVGQRPRVTSFQQWFKWVGLIPCTCSPRPFHIHYFIVLSWHPFEVPRSLVLLPGKTEKLVVESVCLDFNLWANNFSSPCLKFVSLKWG